MRISFKDLTKTGKLERMRFELSTMKVDRLNFRGIYDGIQFEASPEVTQAIEPLVAKSDSITIQDQAEHKKPFIRDFLETDSNL